MNHLSQSPRIQIPYAEFYITHVCNITCKGCNHFNDMKFKGWQRWSDWQNVYEKWSKDVTFGSVCILGGEPLLNPTILDWVDGIRNLWPTVSIRLVTNGFHLLKIPKLYKTIRRNSVHLWVGIHNKMHKKQLIDSVHQFLQGPVSSEFDDSIAYQPKLRLTDANNITVVVEYNWWFHQGAIIRTPEGETLHKSDPDKAHATCHMKTCHTFFNGQLYKCGVVAVLPDYDQQFHLRLDPADRQLMHDYQPLMADASIAEKTAFIENLPQRIDQCKFCPEIYHGQQIWSEEKKVVFQRRD